MVRTGTRFRAKKASSHYDVIVIGSGIGGLCNAALLSKLGQKVCVLEQHYTAGGYTHAYERNGYEWDVGVHYVGEVHKPWTTLRRIFDVISDGQLQWAEMDPLYDQIHIGDKVFNFYAGREEFARELKSNFPDESEAIDKYINLIYSVSKSAPKYFAGQAMPKMAGSLYNKVRGTVFPDYFHQSAYEVLSNLTDDQDLIAVLCGQWGDYGLPPKKISFMMHAMIAKHYINGGAYPVGGSQKIAETIIPVIQSAGGEVFTYAGVEEVLIKNNTAHGVRLVKGEEITADAVVSCAGLVPTIERLLPADIVAKHGYDKALNKLEVSSAHLCVYAGFKGTAEELGIPKKNFWIYPGNDHDANLEAFEADMLAPIPLIYISFPSAKDPSWNERNPGKSTVEVVTVCNSEWFKQWQGSTWNKRGEDYDQLKEMFLQRMLDTLFKYMPQLKDHLDFAELSTPLSTQWFQWNNRGEILGLDHTVERFQQNWIHPQTKIKNFYLTGSDVVTAGVGGALMGGVMTTSAMLGLQGRKVMDLIKSWKPAAH